MPRYSDARRQASSAGSDRSSGEPKNDLRIGPGRAALPVAGAGRYWTLLRRHGTFDLARQRPGTTVIERRQVRAIFVAKRAGGVIRSGRAPDPRASPSFFRAAQGTPRATPRPVGRARGGARIAGHEVDRAKPRVTTGRRWPRLRTRRLSAARKDLPRRARRIRLAKYAGAIVSFHFSRSSENRWEGKRRQPWTNVVERRAGPRVATARKFWKRLLDLAVDRRRQISGSAESRPIWPERYKRAARHGLALRRYVPSAAGARRGV